MNNNCKINYKKLAIAIALAGTTAVGNSVLAQESEGPIEEIRVTGSFIARPADRPNPVAVMDNEELKANQRVSVVEAIRDMPQISSANTTGNWNTPTNSINLRGLGARSTLILLNGQRQTIDGNSASQVDVNNLAPAIMLDRIELVLDGASALYGSDAVAGVANFVTRNNFEGAEFFVSSQHANAQFSVPEVLIGGLFGVQSSDMGLVVGAEWLKRSGEMQSQDVFNNARLAEGLITGLYNPGTFGALGPPRPGDTRVQGGWFADPLCGSPLIGGLQENVIWNPAGALEHGANGLPSPGDPFCRGNLTLQRSIIPEQERFTGMAVATKDFNNTFVRGATLELNYARVVTSSSFGTGVPLLALPSLNAVLPHTNPGVIDANQRNPNFPLQDYRTIFTRQASPVEGSLMSMAQQHTFRAALTFDGEFNDAWDWRMTGTSSWNEQSSGNPDTIADRYARALQGYGGGSCKFNAVQGASNDPAIQPGVGNCQYWNPFASRLLAQPGDPTYNSPELADWMTDLGITRGNSAFYSMEGIVTGQLWEMSGGTTGVALGAQYRRQELDIAVDNVSRDGGFGFAPQVIQSWDSTRETKAIFAEMVIFPVDNFELDIAARYESTDGLSSVEPKVSALWTPTDRLYVRASAGSSFRLASENQSFGIGPSGTTIRDIGGEVTQARALSVGNPNLAPETSQSWTLGFTWDVTDSVTMDLTWWHYDFEDLVTIISPDDILLADRADGFITDPRIELFPGAPNEICEITGRWDPATGNANRPADCMTGFDVALFKSSFINQDRVRTNGFDFNFTYRQELLGGEGRVTLNGAWINEYSGTDTNGNLIDVVGTDGGNVAGVGTNPRLRGNLIFAFNKGNHSARWTARFTDGTTLRNPNLFNQNTSEASFTQHDAFYTYTLPTINQSSFTLAVLNVADRMPPLFANTLTTVNSALFDPRGRMIRGSFEFSF